MKHIEGTIQRSGRYHLNLRIPVGLLHNYPGKTHLRRSLKTADPTAAANEVTLAEADFLKEGDALRVKATQEAALGALSADQRELYFRSGGLTGLVRAYESSLLSLRFMEAADPRADTGRELGFERRPTSYDDEAEEDISPMLDRMQIAAHQADVAVITEFAREEAKTLVALGRDVEVPGGHVAGLCELMAAYFEARGTPKLSQRSFGYPVRRFIELHGDLPLGDLTMEHLRIFAVEMKRITPSRKGGIHKLSFHQNVRAAKRLGLELMSEDARHNNVERLQTLMKWAPSQGYVTTDPWASFKLDKLKQKFSATKRTREAFSGEAVAEILAYVSEHRHPDTIDRWAPILSAYQGARREEIGQMQMRDVFQIDGEWVMRITDEGEDGKVKNRASLRNLPIHPKVEEAGFIEFVVRQVDERQAPEDAYLFREELRKDSGVLKELSLDDDERVAGRYGQRFSKDLKRMNIKRPELVFHSFRHTWETVADQTSMPPKHRLLLAGRSTGEGSQDLYGDGPSIRQGREALNLIDPLTLVTGRGLRGS